MTKETPSIDHGILSPSGRVSKRFRALSLKRASEILFDGIDIGPKPIETPERERLLRQARELRECAARGLKPKAFIKRALELEKAAYLIKGDL